MKAEIRNPKSEGRKRRERVIFRTVLESTRDPRALWPWGYIRVMTAQGVVLIPRL